MENDFERNSTIISRDKQYIGRTTGAKFQCQMSGCNGLRITTKWEDNTITHPCSKGIVWDKTLNSYILE